jgi:hypothetical protein
MTVEIKRRFRKTVGFRFDALAVFLLCQQYNIDIEGLDKIPKKEYVNSWCWCAYRSFCTRNYHKPVYSYEQMKRFIDNLRKKEWDLILDSMVAARAPDSKGEDKKKVEPGLNSLQQDGRQD